MTVREQAQWVLVLLGVLYEADAIPDAYHAIGAILLPDEYRANHRFTPVADLAIMALSRSEWYIKQTPGALEAAIRFLDERAR